MMVPDFSELVEAMKSLDKNSLSMLFGLFLLLFGLFLLSSVSRISNTGKDIVDAAIQKASQPRVIQSAEHIKEQVKRPQDAIPLMIVEAERLAA